MELREIGKAVGGIAVGKLENHYVVPALPAFPVAGVNLTKIILGAAQTGIAVWQQGKFVGITRDVIEAVGLAGVYLIVDELAKAAGIASPQIYVNRKYTPIKVVPPVPPGLVKVD